MDKTELRQWVQHNVMGSQYHREQTRGEDQIYSWACVCSYGDYSGDGTQARAIVIALREELETNLEPLREDLWYIHMGGHGTIGVTIKIFIDDNSDDLTMMGEWWVHEDNHWREAIETGWPPNEIDDQVRDAEEALIKEEIIQALTGWLDYEFKYESYLGTHTDPDKQWDAVYH